MDDSAPILLIEDNLDDITSIKQALKDLNVSNQLVCLNNGIIALKRLIRKNNQIPCVILINLNMPNINGIRYLMNIKSDEKLKEIPIIALTTSRKEQNVIESYKLGVAGYIVKPVDYKKFVEAIMTTNLYWLLYRTPIMN